MLGRGDALRIGVVWLVWLVAVLATLVIGLASGAYLHQPGWILHDGLWPLYAWDYNWYVNIARNG